MRPAALALALLLALPLASLPSAQAAGAPLEWWGPKAIDQGFHMRIPVAVSNPHPFPVSNAPVAAEIDVAAKLIEAGWTKATGGDRDLLAGFHLDAASIRVVSMTNLVLPADNVNGRLKVADGTFPGGDDRRYEVPSLHIEGSLGDARSFDAAVDPVITVLWRVPGTLQPGEGRSFVVYFDSDRTATPKEPRADGLTLSDGDVRSLFWGGPSLTSFGYVTAPAGQAGRIQVSALHAATRILSVKVAPIGATGSVPAPFQELTGTTFPVLGAYESVQIPVSTAGPVAVLVATDRPAVVQASSAGFVPSTDGGMTGRDFLFYTTDAALEQDVLYVKALDPRDEDGVAEPTRVEVTAVGTGKTMVFQTGGEDNPFDYTVGARAAMAADGGPECRDPGPSPYLSPVAAVQTVGPALYRARVVAGERVTLQLLPVHGVTQAPSAIGAPAGQEFWAAGPWSDDVASSASQCQNVVTRAGVWLASATDAAGTGNVTSPELSYQVSPPGTPSPPGPQSGRFPAPQPIPAAPAFSAAASLVGRPAADRPLRLATSEEAVALVGHNPQATGNLPVHGPFGGDDAGRTFLGVGRSLVFAPFAGTSMAVQAKYAQGTAAAAIPLATQGVAVIDDQSPSNPLRSFRLDANHPVLAVPASASTSFFPGVPAFLAATPGRAEYRGYLVDLASESGLDPLTSSTAPGLASTHTLRLHNRAKALDGSSLPDLVRLTAQVPAGWTATADGIAISPTQGPTFSLAGGQSKAIDLVVTPPAGLESGKSGTVSLLAASQNNELVRDVLDVVVFVKTTYDVGLWFDAIDGPKEQENRSMSAANVAEFRLVVQNQGSRPETIRLSTKFKAGETTWAARLGGPDGGGVLELALGPRQSAAVRLALQAPAGLVDGDATVVVTAEVVGVAGSQDAVQATGTRRAPADLILIPDGLTRFTSPGGNATFNLTLRNRGAGASNVLFAVRSGASTAWGAPKVLVAGVPTDELAIDPGSSLRLQVVVAASPAGLAGQATNLRFSARPEGSSAAALEAVLTGVVRAVHSLDADFPPLPLSVAAGQNTTVDLRLTNRGNLDERVLVRPASLPVGWRIVADDEVLVPRGKTVPLRVDVVVPPGTPEISANLTLQLVAHDGNVTSIDLPVAVGPRAHATPTAPKGRAVQPGSLAAVEVPVANDGNLPLLVTAVAAPGEAWPLAPPMPVRLLPGERSAVQLAWQVPSSAPDGPSTHRATLSLQAEGLAAASAQPIEVAFDVGRADLALESATAVPGPAGQIVHATVANRGDRPARSFQVTLLLGDEAVDEVTVGELKPGEAIEVTLLQARPGAARLALDRNATVVESLESNNVLPLAGSGGRDAPPGAAGWSLLGLAVAALARRRRQ